MSSKKLDFKKEKQHHGRDMLKEGESLVCWRKLFNDDDLEVCQEELPLFCPHCKNGLKLK